MSIVLDTNKHGSVGEYVKDNTLRKANIDIASSIFTIYAYDELKKVLDDTSKFRFLFNEPTFIEKLESNQKALSIISLKNFMYKKMYLMTQNYSVTKIRM